MSNERLGTTESTSGSKAGDGAGSDAGSAEGGHVGCGGPADPYDPVTLIGLVFESADGLRRHLGPSLEKDYGLPPQSAEVLIRLARSPGARLRMTDLASQTALTPSGLTRAVDRLTEAGLATREACENDRRGAFAALTETGRTIMEAALGCHRRQAISLLDGVFERHEHAELVASLRRLRDRVNPGAARVSEE